MSGELASDEYSMTISRLNHRYRSLQEVVIRHVVKYQDDRPSKDWRVDQLLDRLQVGVYL